MPAISQLASHICQLSDTGSQTQSPSAASNFTAIAAGFSWIRRADWSDGMARLGSLLTDLVGG